MRLSVSLLNSSLVIVEWPCLRRDLDLSAFTCRHLAWTVHADGAYFTVLHYHDKVRGYQSQARRNTWLVQISRCPMHPHHWCRACTSVVFHVG